MASLPLPLFGEYFNRDKTLEWLLLRRLQPLKLLYLVELVDDYGLFTSAPPRFFSMASRCTRGGGNIKV